MTDKPEQQLVTRLKEILGKDFAFDNLYPAMEQLIGEFPDLPYGFYDEALQQVCKSWCPVRKKRDSAFAAIEHDYDAWFGGVVFTGPNALIKAEIWSRSQVCSVEIVEVEVDPNAQ